MAKHAYAQMYADRSFTDVEVKSASEDVVIPAHKVVLATASSTLRTMLLSEMVEAKTSKIIIKASYKSIKVFVKYMYTYDDSDLGSVTDFMLVELYHLSIFYDISDLERGCREKMGNRLHLSNLTEFLFIAEKYQMAILTKKCIDMIDENAMQLMRTDNWCQFLYFRPRLTELLRKLPPSSAVLSASSISAHNSRLKSGDTKIPSVGVNVNVDCSAQIINFLLFDEDGLLKSCPIAEMGMEEEQATTMTVEASAS
jgi:hypothetical protein